MTESEPDLMDPLHAFAELGRIKLGDTDIDGVLANIARLAKRTIPGADEVSVTLVRGNVGHTAAFTGELALALDESQYERGHGPCLQASAEAATMSLPDMGTETRWPDFAARALQAGCRSSLSIGLALHEVVSGALNVYGGRVGAFDDDGVVLAETFSRYAAVALANAYLYDSQAALAQHMQAAMQNRAVIEQAKGIIMGERRCTADEAFGILSRLSQETNRKLRDVATALVARASGTAGQ